MADPTLAAQADALFARYQKGFAGRSRATRDLAALDAIIADTRALLGNLDTSATLRAQVEERLATWETEREAIAAVQAGGPEAIAAWRLVEWSEATWHRYGREFGGQPRPTRDLALLGEMIADQKRWLAAAKPVADRLQEPRLVAQVEQMAKNVELYTTEQAEIAKARLEQAPVDRVGVLAACANRQFALYRLHFEGKDRRSRRPALLRRMIGGLRAIQVEMEAVRAAGVTVPVNAENIQKVADRVRHHEAELAKIEAARTNTPTPQLAGMLGDDANAWISRYRATYAGKTRDAVELEPLAEIDEGLHEVARAMDELDRERPGYPTNTKNLGVVIEQLKMMEREFVAIRSQRRRARA